MGTTYFLFFLSFIALYANVCTTLLLDLHQVSYTRQEIIVTLPTNETNRIDKQQKN